MKNILLLLGVVLCAFSCNDRTDEPIITDETETPKTYEVKDLNATQPILYYSLRENKVIPISEVNTENWDIAFFNEAIQVNGGKIRAGKGGAVALDNYSFDALEEVPEGSIFRQDESEKSYELAIPLGTGKGWYNYGRETKVYTPIANRFFVIRTADGKSYAKLKIKSYYEGNPSKLSSSSKPGYYTFDYSFIKIADTETIITNTITNLDAQKAIVYYSIRDNKIIPASEKDTDKWDIGFRYVDIYINGGTGLAGKGGVALVNQTYDNLKIIPNDTEFKTDEENAPAIGRSQWYSYDMSTHTISPIASRTFVIRTADGKGYAKLKIDNWYKDSDNSNILTGGGFYSFTVAYQPSGSKIVGK